MSPRGFRPRRRVLAPIITTSRLCATRAHSVIIIYQVIMFAIEDALIKIYFVRITQYNEDVHNIHAHSPL